jgi:hypothetical protein
MCQAWTHLSQLSWIEIGRTQNEAEHIGSWYRSNVNMQNLPKLYEIRKKPILDPGAMMPQRAGTDIWCCDTPKNTQTQQHKKVARNKCNRNWQSSRHNYVEAVDQLFGANKGEIKQKTLEALGLLRQADHALDEVFKYFDNLTKDV